MAWERKAQEVGRRLVAIERDHAPAVFASSLGLEDMVLTDLIMKHAPGIGILTLDTGRLPEETYRLMDQVAGRYGVRMAVYFPDTGAVEGFTRHHGLNAFYESVPLRRECCRIRKVEPLGRALAAKKAWITGLRREQAATRQEVAFSEFDSDHGLSKFNPLADWTLADVWGYIRAFDVPYNTLHDRDYPSIGCAPCTRAVAPGEDLRAGRWWWESGETKECGCHAREEEPLAERHGTA